MKRINKRASSAQNQVDRNLQLTLSPSTKAEEDDLRGLSQNKTLKTPNKSAPDVEYVSIPYEEWFQMKEVYK